MEKEKEIGDQVEEALLRKHDAVQASLRGMYKEALGGCPHRHGVRDSVDACDANEMRPCVYETGDGPCEVFQEILEEWRVEFAICPECGQERPDDERVKAGMKCVVCAGYAERDPYQEYLEAGVAPGGMGEAK